MDKMDDRSAAYQLYVGIDVAAYTFTAAWLTPGATPSPPLAGEQAPSGFTALQRGSTSTS